MLYLSISKINNLVYSVAQLAIGFTANSELDFRRNGRIQLLIF